MSASEEVVWRRRRAYNWEGTWREDKSLQTGMAEMMVVLQYPWAIKQVSFQWKNPDFLFKNPDFLLTNVDFITKQMIKASPGPSWLLSDQTDDGHTLEFDTNSRLMNKLIKLVAIKIRYGDNEATAPRYANCNRNASFSLIFY